MITAREKKLMMLAYAAGVSAEQKRRKEDPRDVNSPLGMAINWAMKNGQTARWQALERRLY